MNMSIADVVDGIEKVARCFDTPLFLIAHSMGGLAAQFYASAHEVGALVLLTPVVPSNVGATPHELPIGDMDAIAAASRRRSANVFSGLGRHAGRAFLLAPRPRTLAGLRGDALSSPSTPRNSPRLSLLYRVRSTF